MTSNLEFLGNTPFSIEDMVNSTPSCMKIISRDGTLLSMNAQGLALIEAENMASVRGANVYDIVLDSHAVAGKGKGGKPRTQ